MSRSRYIKPLETLSNLDTWLADPGITELRRAELEAARDRVAAIRTAAIMNGVEEEDDGSSRDLGQPSREVRAKASKTVKRSRNKRHNMD